MILLFLLIVVIVALFTYFITSSLIATAITGVVLAIIFGVCYTVIKLNKEWSKVLDKKKDEENE